jgi:ketosteroid isomerase-like protein
MRSRLLSRLLAGLVVSGLVVTGLVTASCSSLAKATPSNEADLAALASYNKRYLQSINDGDIKTLSSLTSEEHIMLPPGRQVVGKAANDAANGKAFELNNFEEHWYPLETVVSGDIAYERGTYTVDAAPKAGGDKRHVAGSFLRIYRRQPDGGWKMIRDMFN